MERKFQIIRLASANGQKTENVSKGTISSESGCVSVVRGLALLGWLVLDDDVRVERQTSLRLWTSWVIPAAGGTAHQITNDPAADESPAWSPDGSQIAFTSDRSGNADIWLIPSAGGPATQITTDEAEDYAPCWSPDGRQIAFRSRRSRSDEIW
jgi:WD40 repeat protein